MKRTLSVTLLLSVAVFLLPSTANAGSSHHGHHSFHHTLHHIGHLFGGHHYGGHHYGGYHFGGHHSGIHLSFGSRHHYGYGYPYRSSYSYYPRRTYLPSYRYYRSPTCRYISPVRTYAVPRSTSSYRVVYTSHPRQNTGAGVSSPLDRQPADVEPDFVPPPAPVPPQPYEADENVVAQPQVLFTSLARSGPEARGPVQDSRTSERRLQTKSASLPDVTSAALGVVAPKTRRLLSDDAIPWVAE